MIHFQKSDLVLYMVYLYNYIAYLLGCKAKHLISRTETETGSVPALVRLCKAASLPSFAELTVTSKGVEDCNLDALSLFT